MRKPPRRTICSGGGESGEAKIVSEIVPGGVDFLSSDMYNIVSRVKKKGAPDPRKMKRPS